MVWLLFLISLDLPPNRAPSGQNFLKGLFLAVQVQPKVSCGKGDGERWDNTSGAGTFGKKLSGRSDLLWGSAPHREPTWVLRWLPSPREARPGAKPGAGGPRRDLIAVCR